MEIIGQFIKSQMDYFNPYVKDISLGYCVQPQSSKTVLRIGLQDSQNIYLCFLESKIPLKHISSLQLYSVTPILFFTKVFSFWKVFSMPTTMSYKYACLQLHIPFNLSYFTLIPSFHSALLRL